MADTADKPNWRDIAEQASTEQDSEKLLELAKQLEKAIDEDQQQKADKKKPDSAPEKADRQKAG